MKACITGCIALLLPALAAGQDAPPACDSLPVYHALDFWVGDWDVYVGDERVGTNRIENILKGCAVLEHWTGSGGGQGKSLFYVDDSGTWQQAWVTEHAVVPGGVKEKTWQVIEVSYDDGSSWETTFDAVYRKREP